MESDVVAAASIFPSLIRDTMIGIAGAESDFTLARGDLIGSTYVINGKTGTIPQTAWNCAEYTSFGPWQINLPANHYLIEQLSGIDHPCGQAEWLLNYNNSARAALVVYQRAGLGAWTTYRTGEYLKYVPASSSSSSSSNAISSVSASSAAANDLSIIATSAAPVAETSGTLPIIGIIAIAFLLGGLEAELV